MSTHKYINILCCIAVVFSLILTVLFMNAGCLGITKTDTTKGYESRLFDTETVHTIDIVMNDWDDFIENCENEEYSLCTVVIDQEAYKNVGIRAKGNTSLTQVERYGNNRYSFKIEFDHYDSEKNYYGLDKLSLNNIIQDNTYIKDFLTYDMMREFHVDAPLCSFANITVNGENWGLYLAVESIEESFLERNYGNDYGKLYKPDSTSMGGGRGNGGRFAMSDWENGSNLFEGETPSEFQEKQRPEGETPSEFQEKQRPEGETPPEFQKKQRPSDIQDKMPNDKGMDGGMGSDDVKLVYTDDEYESYANIFDNAKTDITNADKDRLIDSLKQLNNYENLDQIVNVDEVIRYFVVHNFVCNFDSYTGSMIHNYYLYEKDGQFSMIPWDYNLAFGGFQGANDADELVNYPIDSPVFGGTVESRPMLAWIFSNEEYTSLYHEYFAEFISAYFDSGYFTEKIGCIKEMIAPYVENDTTKFCTYEEFCKGIDTLKEFCLLRAESLTGQLNGTIPATNEEQKTNSASFVDASSINIADMGSMKNDEGGMDKMDFRERSQEMDFQERPQKMDFQMDHTMQDGKRKILD